MFNKELMALEVFGLKKNSSLLREVAEPDAKT